MMTIGEYYKDFVQRLLSIYDDREAANITDWVFESIGGMTGLKRITDRHESLDTNLKSKLDTAFQQLLQHEPVQYVLGEAWFYKMKLRVNEHVLIPRPETEELVEWVAGEIRNKKEKIRNEEVGEISSLSVLDIGTGSGCIAIAIKKELPVAVVTGIDVSNDALAVAKENARNQKSDINFKQLDFLDEKLWASLQVFDFIVSNPPYIPVSEKNGLAKNVTEHEPHLALFTPDDDPFIFYKKIAGFAETHLAKGGKIFVEVHENYSGEVAEIFKFEGFNTEIRKDIYGRDRMVGGSR